MLSNGNQDDDRRERETREPARSHTTPDGVSFGSGTVQFADPYADVDWDVDGRHRGQFHAHPHYGDIGPPQDVYDRYVELGYDVVNVQPKSGFDRGNPWPLEEMGDMDDEWESRYPSDDGVIAIPGVEYERIQHLVGVFTEVMADELEEAGVEGGLDEPEPQYDTAEYLAEAEATPDSVDPLLFLGHPGRYRREEHWDGPWDDEWIDHYERMLEMNPVLGLEAITYGFNYDDRDLWDYLLEHAAPDRPVVGTSVDDVADLGDADRGWVTFYLSDEEFTPRDQRAAQESVWRAWVSGRTSFSTSRQSGAGAPSIERVEHDRDAGTITIDATGHDVVEWISEGDVVETGSTVEYARSDEVGSYLRAQVVEGDPDEPTALTCTQAWHFDWE